MPDFVITTFHDRARRRWISRLHTRYASMQEAKQVTRQMMAGYSVAAEVCGMGQVVVLFADRGTEGLPLFAEQSVEAA